MSDYIAKIDEFYAKKPIDDRGLLGRMPYREEMRELLNAHGGTSGGKGSWQTDQLPVAAPPVVQGQEGGGASGGTKRVIITDSGVANYYDIVATYVGPV